MFSIFIHDKITAFNIFITGEASRVKPALHIAEYVYSWKVTEDGMVRLTVSDKDQTQNNAVEDSLLQDSDPEPNQQQPQLDTESGTLTQNLETSSAPERQGKGGEEDSQITSQEKSSEFTSHANSLEFSSQANLSLN